MSTDKPYRFQVFDAFIAGARWARLAADRAFDDALLDQDAQRYVQDLSITVRGHGTLAWWQSLTQPQQTGPSPPPSDPPSAPGSSDR